MQLKIPLFSVSSLVSGVVVLPCFVTFTASSGRENEQHPPCSSRSSAASGARGSDGDPFRNLEEVERRTVLRFEQMAAYWAVLEGTKSMTAYRSQYYDPPLPPLLGTQVVCALEDAGVPLYGSKGEADLWIGRLLQQPNVAVLSNDSDLVLMGRMISFRNFDISKDLAASLRMQMGEAGAPGQAPPRLLVKMWTPQTLSECIQVWGVGGQRDREAEDTEGTGGQWRKRGPAEGGWAQVGAQRGPFLGCHFLPLSVAEGPMGPCSPGFRLRQVAGHYCVRQRRPGLRGG